MILNTREALITRSPLALKLGVEIEAVEPDRVRVRLPFRKDNVTLGEMVHGGAIATLADIAATAAAWSGVEPAEGQRGSTIGLTIAFQSPALGCDLVADARVTRRGRAVCFIDVRVLDDQGNLIASAMVTYRLSAPRPEAKPPGDSE
jgi:uncharacterized protein (TIGR00369 family)